MRSITIRYRYDGPEDPWRETIAAFIAALDSDPEVTGRFTYQVAVADDGVGRIHWGRWDTKETLATMQSRDYFKTFAAKVKEFAGGQPESVAAEVGFKTKGW